MSTHRWIPAALALSLAPGIALAQDRTADPTKSTADTSKTTADPTKATETGASQSALPDVGRDKTDKASASTSPAQKPDTDPGDVPTGSSYTLWKLHQANQMEIQMSELALTNASSKAVKDFAQKMISDHRGADLQVTRFAKKVSANLDAKAPAPDKAEMDEAMSKMDQLKSIKGSDFDAQFAKQMADDHMKVVDLVTTAINDPAQADIKPLLSQLLPKLQQHQKLAMRLANDSGGSSKARARAPRSRGDSMK
jgi:putative membrane protein